MSDLLGPVKESRASPIGIVLVGELEAFSECRQPPLRLTTRSRSGTASSVRSHRPRLVPSSSRSRGSSLHRFVYPAQPVVLRRSPTSAS